MTVPTFFISEAVVRTLKQRTLHGVSGISSSHLSEAVAAALGFKTLAALRAALTGHVTAKAQKPSNAQLVQRLRQFGYDVPNYLRLLPEFEHSYSPFKTFPLRTQRSVRWWAWRNLMVAALMLALNSACSGCQRARIGGSAVPRTAITARVAPITLCSMEICRRSPA